MRYVDMSNFDASTGLVLAVMRTLRANVRKSVTYVPSCNAAT